MATEAVRSPEATRTARIHEPFRVGLPPLGAYVGTLWKRRAFALELARSELRAQQINTAFGPLWLVLNPLLLAAIYFVLIDILSGGTRGGDFFAHLLVGLFIFTFVQQATQLGAKSVVSAGQLILNTAFPRMLLPLAATTTAFLRFVPTLVVYVPIHLASGLPGGSHLLWALPLLVLFIVLAAGVATAAAATQVYLRDLSNFLPYAMRFWLYASPVLYFADEIPERYDVILAVNPLGPLLTAWSDVLVGGRAPAAADLALGAGWALALFAAGALFFLSRERQFAVRL